jgi:serine protease inhibitor
MLKIIVILICCAVTFGAKYQCSDKSAQLMLKKPTYEFSVKLLDRVSQVTDGHFVYSPISTWLQLLSLSEGAHGKTLKEIWNVTKHHRLKCFRRKMKLVLNRIDKEFQDVSLRKSFMIIDRLMAVKKPFIREVQRLRSMEVLLLDFNYPVRAADIANRHVISATNGNIIDAFSPDDFNSTVLLTADASYYKSVWKIPFNSVYTKKEQFYSEIGQKEGEVDMMNRMDYFNCTVMPSIKAKVLELPCGSDNRISMLVFLPTSKTITDMYYLLPRIRLMTIFNKFRREKAKLINVKLPRFNITSDIDIVPELLYDMGVKRVFHPDLANLRGISDYKIYTSLMTQVAKIEVNEAGVTASAVADFLVSNRVSEEFTANRPFGYMLVDRKSELILFAGMYSSTK